MQYASPFQRLAGFLIDIIILLPISLVIHKSNLGNHFVLSNGTFFVLEGIYYVSFWFFKKSTIGMIIMGIYFSTDPGKLTVGRAIKRYIVMCFSTFCLGIGGFWMLWDKNNQTWQDKIAKTYALKRTREAKKV